MKIKGVSSVVSIVIVVVVTLLVAIAFAFYWASITGLFTSSIEDVQVNGNLKVHTNWFELMLCNKGTAKVVVDKVLINGRDATIYSAFGEDGESVLVQAGGDTLIAVKPGFSVTVRGYVQWELDPNIAYEIKIHTTGGKEFSYVVKAVRANFEAGSGD